MRIAITRPSERADETIELVRERGWEALVFPAIELVPRSAKEIAKGVGRLADYHWLVLTSAYGAEIMAELFGDELRRVKVAVIGPKTKAALEKRGFSADFQPRSYISEALAKEMVEKVRGKRVLLARASIGREELAEELRKANEVVEVPLYDSVMPRDISGMREFKEALLRGAIDALILTSAQSAKNVLDFLGEEGKSRLRNVVVCAIGPHTAEALTEQGIRVDLVPEEYTIAASLDALERMWK